MNSKPSKSALKREQLALQALGEQLIGLDAGELATMGLDERLLDAVMAAQKMNSHGALRRQKQLIGKLMRQVDPAPIRAALDRRGAREQAGKKVFRDAEGWRDRIVETGRPAVDEFADFLGHRSEPVEEAAAALASARFEKAEKEAKRRLFREIHRELLDGMQKEADSI